MILTKYFMIKLKALLNNKWFFPILVLYYGIFYILFGENYPFNGGFSTDGYVFGTFIPDFKQSPFFDTYYVQRILPSLLITFCFKVLSINNTGPHIFNAFQIFNLASIVISCYFFKQILVLLKISLKNQLLAFVLFLLNFGIIKYPFYMPVMTDTFAMMLSVILLYFYLKNNLAGLILITLMLAFTWPMGYYQGLLLIALPLCILPFSQPQKWQKQLVYGASVLYIFILSVYFIYVENRDMTVRFVMKIDRNLLPLSIGGIILMYFFFSKIFFNKTLINTSLFIKKLNYKRILLSITTFLCVYLTIKLLNPGPVPRYSTEQTLRDPIVYSLIKPLISLVADTSYFGVIICLLFIFWNSFCKVIAQMGWGLVAAFALNLFLFGIAPQSRHLINLLPWLIIFLIKAINKYSFSKHFYIAVAILSFVASKIWLTLNLYANNPPAKLDKNGSLGFPDQVLWMNIGPWMNEQMYYVQGAVMVLFTAILFMFLYKIQFSNNKILFLKKFQPLK